MTEQDLVKAARSGDKDAFSQLLSSYQAPIYNLCYRMLGQFSEAEDATQETFLRAYSQMNRYDPDRPLKSWLFAIASHHCIDRLRKRRVTWLGIHEESLSMHPALREARWQPENEALQMELSLAIQVLLARLQPPDRNAIIMRYWYGMSYQEIAEVTGSTISAVKSRLHRARTTMGEMMMAADRTRQGSSAAPDTRTQQASGCMVDRPFASQRTPSSSRVPA
jgi:RNA polymerase sigma-70 factor, ECF subfamily